MPFIPNTPESLLKRNDSKNPATTCKGIRNDGYPCRRDIKSQLADTDDGVVAVLSAEDDDHDGAAAYFCWQHKDQAATLVSKTTHGRKANVVPLKGRTSVDTLVERLGIVDLNEKDHSRKKKQAHIRQARRETLPQSWQDVDGEMLAVQKRPKPKKPSSNVGLFCCIRARSPSPEPAPKPVKRPARKGGYTMMTAPVPSNFTSQAYSHRPQSSHPSSRPSVPPSPSTQRAPFHSSISNPSTPPTTAELLKQIPPNLPAQTTSYLLAELLKPIPTTEARSGYIYMFWQTPASSGRPDDREASSLLSDPQPATPTKITRENTIRKYAGNSARSPRSSAAPPKTVLLKIGSAANVTRRLNQWQAQCDYELSLIRYYPSTSTSTALSPPSTPSKSPGHNKRSSLPAQPHRTSQPNPTSLYPHASPSPRGPARPAPSTSKSDSGMKDAGFADTSATIPNLLKVERLIHLQLADKRVKRQCETCGKEHREWFEVPATAEGVRDVDAVCRWWVDWGMRWGYRGKGGDGGRVRSVV